MLLKNTKFCFSYFSFLWLFSVTSLFAEESNSSSRINWQDWSPSAFEKARQENKMILVNVGLEGCTACKRMDTFTYQNEEVIRIVNANFVAIAVDSQARPDVGERYSDWGWPATAFLTPEATQVFALSGNRLPRNFIPILHDLMLRQQQSRLQADPHSPYAAQPHPVTRDLLDLRDKVRRQLDSQFDRKVGGWTDWGLNAEMAGARLQHLYMRAHLRKDESQKQAAIKVSETYIRALDPVWGGAFEASINEEIEEVPAQFKKLRAIPEKRISSQSNAIIAFANAYSVTQDEKYRRAAESVDHYLDTWLKSPEGLWYANQKSSPTALPKDWWPQDYWLLPSHDARAKYGFPPIDHAIYSDKAAEVILAYLHAYEAFANPDFLQKASTAAHTLLEQRLHQAGWIQQSVSNEALQQDTRIHPFSDIERPFLRTQARVGLALLKLYQISADPRWLDAAKGVAQAAFDQLLDKSNNGFWAAPLSAMDNIIKPRKPLEDNALMAQFYFDLYVLTRDPRFEFVPEKTLRATASDTVLQREGKVVGETALLLEKLTAHYVEFTIVTQDINSAKSQVINQRVLNTYHPRKIMHFEAPGRYPELNEPALFICNPNRCSFPITDPEQIKLTADKF